MDRIPDHINNVRELCLYNKNVGTSGKSAVYVRPKVRITLFTESSASLLLRSICSLGKVNKG